MNSWILLKLGKTKTQFLDGDRSDKYPSRSEFTDSGVLFLNSEAIKSGRINIAAVNFISQTKFDSISKGRINKNDILMTTRGNGIGDVALVTIEEPGIINAQMLILRTNKQELESNYLYQYLRTNAAKEQIVIFSSGSAQPQIPIRDLKHIPIPLPPLPVQRKIAAVLSGYDDLIENNRRRIALLEKAAEELYREWFVRLRFPGHEKTKIVKGVPEGWEVKQINEVTSVIDCLHTKKPIEKSDGTGWLLQLENIGINGEFKKQQKYLIDKDAYDEWTKNIEVKENDCLITNVGRIAAIAQIPRGVRAALGRNMTAVRPDKISTAFLIQYLLSSHMQLEVQRKQDVGTIMNALNVRAINKLQVITPTPTLLCQFDSLITPLRTMIWNHQESIDLLTTARDRLLSRLMSGKIDVEDLDIRFPPSMREEAE